MLMLYRTGRTIAFLSALAILVVIFIITIFIIADNNDDLSQNEGIQVQLIGAGGGIIEDNSNVRFDTIFNDQSSDIDYDSATGEFTIHAPGNYYISWSLAVDGAGPMTYINYTVTVNGNPYASASSPIVSGELSGTALVTVKTVPTIISLVNTTGFETFVPLTPVQGNLVILK